MVWKWPRGVPRESVFATSPTIERLRASILEVEAIADTGLDADAVAATAEGMRCWGARGTGVAVANCGAGRTDNLMRVETPSDLGRRPYEDGRLIGDSRKAQRRPSVATRPWRANLVAQAALVAPSRRLLLI